LGGDTQPEGDEPMVDLAKHVHRPGEGERIEMRGPTAGSITILVDPANTGTTELCALIQTLNPGAAVPVHRHERAEQVLHFLSGRGTVVLGEHEVEATPGTTVHVPRGVEHGIANSEDTPLSFLEATTPPGFQEAFRAMGRLAEPTPEAIAEVAGHHDILIARG
jgi:mannose-6-phosphate isomerase-like protein (cupin superfamily)